MLRTTHEGHGPQRRDEAEPDDQRRIESGLAIETVQMRPATPVRPQSWLDRASVVALLLVAPLVLRSGARAQEPFGSAPHALDGVPPAITIPLDCLYGIRFRQLSRRFGELQVHPHPQRARAEAIALAGDFLAMAERCPEEPGHTWILVHAGYTLAFGGEVRWAAEQFLRAQEHARSQSEASVLDGGFALRELEVEAAVRRAMCGGHPGPPGTTGHRHVPSGDLQRA